MSCQQSDQMSFHLVNNIYNTYQHSIDTGNIFLGILGFQCYLVFEN